MTGLLFGKTWLLVSALTFTASAMADNLMPLVDDFTDSHKNNLGIERIFISDVSAGGKTSSNTTIANGIINVKGDILPPRGQPGWASTVLPLGNPNVMKDASQYQGLKVRVKVNSGQLSVSANSIEVKNFDYHASMLAVPADGKFHEIKIPFDDMKRAWSEQTTLNSETLNSISIVAFAMKQSSFDYEIDDVSFYK